MIGARQTWFGMDREVLADQLRDASTVAIPDAGLCLTQNEAKGDTRTCLVESTHASHAQSPRQQRGPAQHVDWPALTSEDAAVRSEAIMTEFDGIISGLVWLKLRASRPTCTQIAWLAAVVRNALGLRLELERRRVPLRTVSAGGAPRVARIPK